MKEKRPRVGIGIMIFKDYKALVGKRKGSHGAGEYAFPGGHLEHGESFEECARREVREECGIEIKNIRFQFVANILYYLPKHYVHIGFVADWASGDVRVLEPDKVVQWEWHHLSKLPKPLFEACRQQIMAYQSGERYFDLPPKK